MTKQIDIVRIRSETTKEASNEHLSSNLRGFLFYPRSARKRDLSIYKIWLPIRGISFANFWQDKNQSVFGVVLFKEYTNFYL